MTTPHSRRLGVAVTVVSLLIGTAAALAPGAAAAPVSFTPTSRPIVGDLTGDGVADRSSLGYVGALSDGRCAVQVTAGLGKGLFAAPQVIRLPERGDVGCPDLGVVAKGPTPAQNRLATTFFEVQPSDPTLLIQVFGLVDSRFVTRGNLAGIYQPSLLASQDFDGDGWGDLWEVTDQGSGFAAYSGRGSTWKQVYATPFTSLAEPQFADLNHAGGTDIVVTWADFGVGSGVAAVDGRTGAVQVLATGGPGELTDFAASFVDVNHDAYLDLQVIATTTDGVVTTDRFVNRSQGGRWSFRELPSAG